MSSSHCVKLTKLFHEWSSTKYAAFPRYCFQFLVMNQCSMNRFSEFKRYCFAYLFLSFISFYPWCLYEILFPKVFHMIGIWCVCVCARAYMYCICDVLWSEMQGLMQYKQVLLQKQDCYCQFLLKTKLHFHGGECSEFLQ